MTDPLKEIAARAAAGMVENGMRVGLGTGSTASIAIRILGERVRDEGLRITGIPTSLASGAQARDCGIPLTDFETTPQLDLTIDGADEVDPNFDLIKGGGGALLREKVVARASTLFVVVADEGKLVTRLGLVWRLPVEIVPFARHTVEREIQSLGGEPLLRQRDAKPYVTDNHNWILDVRFPDGIADPAATETALDRIPGVVEIGLFVAMAGRIVIGRPGKAEIRERPARPR